MPNQKALSSKPLSVVQFTDTHFFENPDGRLMGVDTAVTFREVSRLAQKQRGAPDFYLLTGDLSQDETAGSYERFGRALEGLEARAYYLPGNHDRRQIMHQTLSQAGAPIKTDRQFTLGAWQVILLDTLVENDVHGHLSDGELEHLERSLAKSPDLHTLVTLHHHPVPMGSDWLDAIGVDNADEFWKIIDKNDHVKGVLWGHVHQQFDDMRKGVKLMATPSTCVQFKPKSEGFAADALPPGYRWLELFADGTITSNVERATHVAAGLDVSSAGY